MTLPTNLRYRFFGGLARLDVDSPWTVLFVTILLAVACVFYTKSRLEFRTGQDDLISTNTRDSRNYLRYTHEFPGLDGLIVVVKTTPSKARAELFADTLARQLEADHTNVSTVFYRLDPSVVGNRGLLYLSVDDLNDLASKLDPNLPMLGAYAINPSLAAIFGIANRQIDNAIATAMRERREPRPIIRGTPPRPRIPNRRLPPSPADSSTRRSSGCSPMLAAILRRPGPPWPV